MIYEKIIFLFLIFLQLVFIVSCTKIHTHGSKEPIPEKEPRKEREIHYFQFLYYMM